MSKIEMSLVSFFRQFPDDDAAERHFINARWPDGIRCPRCDGGNVQEKAVHKSMPHRCRDCRRYFSVRTGSIMADSKLGYQTWLLAAYLLHTAKKGMSSIALGEKLGVCQKTAWFLAHRIRETWTDSGELMTGTVEADETYVGGSDKSRHLDRKGKIPKMPVVGARERETGRVSAVVMPKVDLIRVYDWLDTVVSKSARLFTDEAKVYVGYPVSEHRTVKHKSKQYVVGELHTNGIESHWALLKRAYHGTHHWYSHKHMHRYVHECTARFNARDLETIDQLKQLATGGIGKRLTFSELTA